MQVGAAFAETTYQYAHADIQLLAYWITAWSGDLCLRVHDAYRWVEPAELEARVRRYLDFYA